uniref:Uncharacterized protein n=1 Tax=Acrobeloides nanus TaxID=290746 RepID=A0A914E1A3_9BILA
MGYLRYLNAMLFSILFASTLAHDPSSYQSCYSSCYSSCVAGARDEYDAAGCASTCASICAGESMEGSTQFDLYRNSFEPQNFDIILLRNIFDTNFGSGFL